MISIGQNCENLEEIHIYQNIPIVIPFVEPNENELEVDVDNFSYWTFKKFIELRQNTLKRIHFYGLKIEEGTIGLLLTCENLEELRVVHDETQCVDDINIELNRNQRLKGLKR